MTMSDSLKHIIVTYTAYQKPLRRLDRDGFAILLISSSFRFYKHRTDSAVTYDILSRVRDRKRLEGDMKNPAKSCWNTQNRT